MKPLPLDQRIVGALTLVPMSTRQLARVLSVDWRTAWRCIRDLRDEGAIESCGVLHGHVGAPATVWGLA